MTKEQADTLINELEAELRDRLPKGVGVCLLFHDKEAGTRYTSNYPRHLALLLLKSFINRSQN